VNTTFARAFVAALGLVVTSCSTPPPPRPTAPPAPPAVSQPVPPLSAEPLPAEQQPVLVGTVTKVIDGDTVKVQLSSGPISVRFDSIDAPETNQPWGREAQAELSRLLDGQVVDLDVRSQDRYERLVATVYLGDQNVNSWMVQRGHAWAYREYLYEPAYCYLEAAARAGHAGLWSQSAPNAPWEWRKREREPSTFPGFTDHSRDTAETCVAAKGRRGQSSLRAMTSPSPSANAGLPPSGCLIKGNVSDSGRIYHVPGSRSYEQTKIDTSRGERWFCTEDDARAAGWRAPKH
jgi:endonuclease YncB( thermonuclease family)